MAPTAPPDLHTELQRQYDLLTARLADLDCDAGLAQPEQSIERWCLECRVAACVETICHVRAEISQTEA